MGMVLSITFAGSSRFLSRLGAGTCGSGGRSCTANMPAFSSRRVVFGLSSTRAAFLATVSFFIHRSPSTSFGLVVRNAALLVAFLDVLGHSLLLAAVAGFISTRHCDLPLIRRPLSRNSYFFGWLHR
jgi:hypothetical protein